MNSEALGVLLRVLLVSLSFFGLCAEARGTLKLNRYVAPFFAACGIIAVLMLSGMLRVLGVGLAILYLGGAAGWIHTYFIRKVRPDFVLMAMFALFAAYLAWRFYPCPLARSDDVSHWGLVARHLLENDAFPDRSASIVAFQSYPLGSACFIYYICRATGGGEGMWLAAQNLLMGLFFLPVLAHIRENKGLLLSAALGLFIYMFKSNRVLVNLQVDWLLGFFGFGAVAAVTAHRDDLRRALPVGLLAAVAVVYIKNSGMFFAMGTVLVLAAVVRQQTGRRSDAVKTVLLGMACFIGAYLLWTLHVRLSYPAGLSTKHAVSLSAYAREASGKGGAFILGIGKSMLRELIHPFFYQIFALLFMLGAFVATSLAGRTRTEFMVRVKRAHRLLWLCAAAYAVWYGMLFGMYVFSMPEDEAMVLASYYRYNATGLLYMMGLAAVVLCDFFSAARLQFGRGLYHAAGLAITICILASPFVLGSGFFAELSTRETRLIPLRERLLRAKEEYGLADGGRYMLFAVDGAEERPLHTTSYIVKYELRTADQLIVVHSPKTGLYGCGTFLEHRYEENPMGFIRANLENCDALLVLDADGEFEAQLARFLQDYEGGTPVIFVRDELPA